VTTSSLPVMTHPDSPLRRPPAPRVMGVAAILALVVTIWVSGTGAQATTDPPASTSAAGLQQTDAGPAPSASEPPPATRSESSMTVSVLTLLAFFLVAMGLLMLIVRAGLRSSAVDEG